MSKEVQTAIRTGRSLLNKGLQGRDLKERLASLYPHFSFDQRKAVMAGLKQENGLLGQVVLDPNLARTCVAAKQELRKHPARGTILAVLKTPMCGECQHRLGKSCGLIGSSPLPILSSSGKIPEGIAEATATSLVASGRLSQGRAEALMNRPLSAGQRVSALTRATLRGPKDTTAIKDEARSSRFASAMEASPGVVIRPQRRGTRRRVANPERGRNYHDGYLPGDRKVEREMARVARALEPSGVVVVANKIRPQRKVVMALESVTNIPRQEPLGRTAATLREESDETVVASYERMVRTARRLLANGEMTGVVAGQYLGRFEQYRGAGVEVSDLGKKMHRQIKLLAGHPDF